MFSTAELPCTRRSEMRTMGRMIVLVATLLAIATAAGGQVALADTGGPGVTRAVSGPASDTEVNP